MGAFETADVSEGDFWSLMFFVVAIGNLVLYTIAGWIANVMAQVSSHHRYTKTGRLTRYVAHHERVPRRGL